MNKLATPGELLAGNDQKNAISGKGTYSNESGIFAAVVGKVNFQKSKDSKTVIEVISSKAESGEIIPYVGAIVTG